MLEIKAIIKAFTLFLIFLDFERPAKTANITITNITTNK